MKIDDIKLVYFISSHTLKTNNTSNEFGGTLIVPDFKSQLRI